MKVGDLVQYLETDPRTGRRKKGAKGIVIEKAHGNNNLPARCKVYYFRPGLPPFIQWQLVRNVMVIHESR